MPLYMKISQNIYKTMRHLKFCYISILTNLIYIYIMSKERGGKLIKMHCFTD